MYLKIKLGETNRCPYDFSCLWLDENHRCGRCAVKEVAGENLLALKGKAPSYCQNCLRWSKGEICRCPTNYALYNRSSAMNKTMKSGTGVLIVDENDVIINANSCMERIAGIPVKSIVGINILSGFPNHTVRFFKPYYNRTKRTHECQRYENIPIITPAGRKSHQSGWLIPRVTEGKVTRMVCTVEDVTESKIYVPALREATIPTESNDSRNEGEAI